MRHPDEGMINTWLDGELSPDETAALEAHVAECPECSARVAEARGLAAASSRIVSALDMVPAGVIPAVPPRYRRWYASSQFRAAAAVMIVAGASFLVTRSQDRPAMDSIMTTSSPVALEAAPDSSKVERGPGATLQAPAPATKPAPSASRSASRSASPSPPAPAPPPAAATRPAGGQMKALTGRAEGVQPEADASVVQKADSPTRRLGAATEADFVGKGVKGGVARGVEGGALNAATFPVYRKVRTDSTASAIRTVFELSPGVEVTLTDLTPPPSAPAARQRSNAAAAPVVQSAAPDLKLDSAQSMPVNTVTWTDKRGHTMTLTGRVSTLQMELLRQQLPPEQR